jgi:Fe-S oxidoreductase
MQKLGLDFDVLASGCCGMAGSFGFESDKYDVSVQIGERKLLPAVRKAPLSTVIVADGFSCREQISQQTRREGLHLAEVIQMGLQPANGASDGMYPEEPLVKRRKSARRNARLRALAVLAGLGAAGALAWKLNHR